MITPAVAGTAWDSVAAAPLAGALVQLVAESDRATSFSAVADQAATRESAFAAQTVSLITPERSALPMLHQSQPVLVVGRDIHQHRFAREAVDRLRSQQADVLVVDMGWPSDDRRYADVATFGGSRLMGRALLGWLAASGDFAD